MFSSQNLVSELSRRQVDLTTKHFPVNPGLEWEKKKKHTGLAHKDVNSSLKLFEIC